MEIHESSGEHADSWGQVVYSSSEGSVFHSEAWLRILENSLGLEVTRLLAIDGSEAVGVFPVSFHRSPRQWMLARKFPPFVASPPIRMENPYGGPVSLPEKPDAVVALIKHVLRRQASAEIVFAPDPTRLVRRYPALDHLGAALSTRRTFIVDLKASDQELWARLGPNMRTHVRKARKLGVKFHESKKDSDVEEFHSILRKTYHRSGFSPLPLSFYSEVLGSMGKQAALFFTEVDGQRATCEISLIFRNRLYAWSAGSDERFWPYRPNNLMSYEIMTWARSRGLSSYDQCGSGPPSVAKYKEALGGTVHTYPCISQTMGLHVHMASLLRATRSLLRRPRSRH